MWVLGCNSRPRHQNLEIQKTRNTPYPEEQQESTNANAENQKETRNIRFKKTQVWRINHKGTQKNQWFKSRNLPRRIPNSNQEYEEQQKKW